MVSTKRHTHARAAVNHAPHNACMQAYTPKTASVGAGLVTTSLSAGDATGKLVLGFQLVWLALKFTLVQLWGMFALCFLDSKPAGPGSVGRKL